MAGALPELRRGATSAHQWRLWLSGLVGSRYDGLAHFHVVAPGVLLRCGQPRLADLEQIRAAHGLRTIVVARGGTRHFLRGRWFRRQQAWCQAQGIALEHMPFSDAAVPPAELFERFLALVQAPQCRPVLVHCEQGFHRTGVLCAAFRVRCCGWTLAQALDELHRFGFEPGPKRAPLLAALRQWAERPGRGSPIRAATLDPSRDREGADPDAAADG